MNFNLLHEKSDSYVLIKKLLILSFLESNIGKPEETASESFSIEKTWDDKPIDHDPVRVTLSQAEDNLVIQITAPFFDDPAPENGKVGEAFFKLWDYEVVEAFFLNDKDQYLELEFGPHGQHLSLLLNGNRNAIKCVRPKKKCFIYN